VSSVLQGTLHFIVTQNDVPVPLQNLLFFSHCSSRTGKVPQRTKVQKGEVEMKLELNITNAVSATAVTLILLGSCENALKAVNDPVLLRMHFLQTVMMRV
jgi:hypothetical protein